MATTDEDADFYRWYGAWRPLDPQGIAALMDGFDRPWWLVGGWSIEAFTGVHREHEDVDLSSLACDVPALRAHLGEAWTPWSNRGGTLRPLSDRFPEPFDAESQIWLRRDASSPWDKARFVRPKDDRDLAVTWPLLPEDRRAWLREALVATEGPDHPWLRRTLGKP